MGPIGMVNVSFPWTPVVISVVVSFTAALLACRTQTYPKEVINKRKT